MPITTTLSTSEDRPWDRMKGETDLAWSAFQVYLDLPRPRTYQEVADKLGKSRPLIAKWGSENKWRSRAEWYDNSMMGVMTPEQRDDALGVLQLKITADLHEDYMRLREAWVEAVEQVTGRESITPKDIADLVRARNQMDILARRNARMPQTFTSREKDGLEVEDDDTFLLRSDGVPVKIDGLVSDG